MQNCGRSVRLYGVLLASHGAWCVPSARLIPYDSLGCADVQRLLENYLSAVAFQRALQLKQYVVVFDTISLIHNVTFTLRSSEF